MRIGLDGLVITEHDYQWESDELAGAVEQGHTTPVFSGAEISAHEGHFLVYGLPALDDVPPGIALAELLKVVRSNHAAIVAAHIRFAGTAFDRFVAEHGPAFDALELVSNNITAETRSKTEALLRANPSMELPAPATATSCKWWGAISPSLLTRSPPSRIS